MGRLGRRDLPGLRRRHPGPGLLDLIVKDPREIKDVAFCSREQVADRAADFTARRISAALEARRRGGGAAYSESGRG
ncbi:hypothetical protein [Nocardioides sp.]|uniref:hypothetical protein n=1 Tax=Nocardioides sp. TaxID=35761 RepID=UPI003527D4BC